MKTLTPTRKLFKPRYVESLPFTDQEMAELQSNVKEHVLKGVCTYCSKKLIKNCSSHSVLSTTIIKMECVSRV